MIGSPQPSENWVTSLGTSTEVDIVGEVAFYSQYDWLGRRYFVNLTMGF